MRRSRFEMFIRRRTLRVTMNSSISSASSISLLKSRGFAARRSEAVDARIWSRALPDAGRPLGVVDSAPNREGDHERLDLPPEIPPLRRPAL
jgi:hypothetical protein